MTSSAKTPKRHRMTRVQRREQLIGVGRKLFAAHGYDAVAIEEIASAAGVSKPVIYEHFGGKEGIYQVIVDRETTAINAVLSKSIDGSLPPHAAVESTVLALLDYIETNPDGFSLMVHQSPTVVAGGEFSTIATDMGDQLSELLTRFFDERGFDPETTQLYGQMLAGLMGSMGQWWATTKQPDKRTMATHLVNLIWNGLRGLDSKPTLHN